jgi:hypothetical protein
LFCDLGHSTPSHPNINSIRVRSDALNHPGVTYVRNHIRISHPHLFKFFKSYNIPAVSHQQNPKLQKQFPLHRQNFKKIYFQPVVPVAMLYPLADQIVRVGGLEIGVLGGGLGGFGIVDMDVRIS